MKDMNTMKSTTTLVLTLILCTYALTMTAQSTSSESWQSSDLDLVNGNNVPTEIKPVKETSTSIRRKKNVDNIKVIMMNGGQDSIAPRDTVNELINQFYIDQFRHFSDPDAPYFMFMSRDAKLALGVGGTINAYGWVDWDGSIPDLGFKVYDIPVPYTYKNRRNLAATMANSGFFFTLLGRNKLLGKYKAYIAMKFSNYPDSKFEIDMAYFTFRNMTVGRTTSTFADPAALPPTTDDAGNNGRVNKKNVLVRYMKTLKGNKWTYAGALEFPKQELNCSDTLASEDSPYLPDLTGFIQYQWDGGESHVRLCGLARTLTYRDMVLNKNQKVFGWGAQLSSIWNVSFPVTLYATCSYGKGISSYLCDLSGKKFDLVSDGLHPGRLYAPKTLAAIVAMKYNFLPNLYSDVSISGVRNYANGQPEPTEYKYGIYCAVNTIWEITPRLLLGIEYLHGQRGNYDGQHGAANRLNMLFRLHF